MKPWVTMIIPFCIQLPMLCVQIYFMRKGMRISKAQIEHMSRYLIENRALWKMNRLMTEWIKVNYPESYETFLSVCITDEDREILGLAKVEEVSDEGNDNDRGD